MEQKIGKANLKGIRIRAVSDLRMEESIRIEIPECLVETKSTSSSPINSEKVMRYRVREQNMIVLRS